METGSNNVKLENIGKVAECFKVSLGYLFNGIGQSYGDDDFISSIRNY